MARLSVWLEFGHLRVTVQNVNSSDCQKQRRCITSHHYSTVVELAARTRQATEAHPPRYLYASLPCSFHAESRDYTKNALAETN